VRVRGGVTLYGFSTGIGWAIATADCDRSGVDSTMADYETFWHDYPPSHLDGLSLLDGCKHLLPQGFTLWAPGRGLIDSTRKLDAGLLRRFPGLGRSCLERVDKMRKPADAGAAPATR
jgi:hypothetical protein